MKKAMVLAIACLSLLGGCCYVNGCSNSSSSSQKEVDVFDKENLSVKELEDLGCVFFQDMAFGKGTKSHVFIINEQSIIKHISYDLVNFDPSNYQMVVGMDLIDAIKIIGCPTYLGVTQYLSLDYSDYDGYLRRVFLQENAGNYKISEVEEYYKYDNPSLWVDKNKINHPSVDAIKKLKIGMNIDEVVKTVGKFSSFYDPNGIPPFRPKIQLDDGRVATITMISAQTIDCEYMRHRDDNYNTFTYLYLGYVSLENETFQLPIQEKTKPFECDDNLFSDNSIVTIDYLKSKNCFFYENMVFASDSKNHVFILEGEQITEHRVFEKVNFGKYSYDLFSSVEGMSLFESFEIIGIPSFGGIEGGLSLSYSFPYGELCNARIQKRGNEYYISEIGSIYSEKIYPGYWTNPIGPRSSFNNKQMIKEGMCIDEVLRALGRPKTHAFVDDTAFSIASFVSAGGDRIDIKFKLSPIQNECEYARISKEFNLVDGRFYKPNIYYFYVDSIVDAVS